MEHIRSFFHSVSLNKPFLLTQSSSQFSENYPVNGHKDYVPLLGVTKNHANSHIESIDLCS